MSWHPSRASTEALDPVAPSRYRSAVVRGCAGGSMIVETDDGDECFVPAPGSPVASLVGARVLLADERDWVVAVEPSDPAEAVVIDLGDGTRRPEIDLRPPAPRHGEGGSRSVFGGRLRRARRRTGYLRRHQS